jgi:ABC-type branched-subunit amino acid transport system substrate-binding protein
VEYYKNLGIKKIYLYDNNDIDGENFYSILKSYINSEFIKVKNVRGKSEIQIVAYNDCYQRHLNEYS